MPDNSDFYFEYFDGERTVYGDPLTLNRALIRETRGTLEQLLGQAREADPNTAVPAVERVLAATRSAFRLVPYDPATGRGLMEKDVRAVLKAFRAHAAECKKKAGGKPNASPRSEPASCP